MKLIVCVIQKSKNYKKYNVQKILIIEFVALKTRLVTTSNYVKKLYIYFSRKRMFNFKVLKS